MRKYTRNLFAILRENRNMNIEFVSKKNGLSEKNLIKYENDFGKTPAHIAMKLIIFYEESTVILSLK